MTTTREPAPQESRSEPSPVLRDRRPGRRPAEIVERFLHPRASVEKRMAAGKELRKRVPRSDHGVYAPPRSRTDPVEVLIGQAKTRNPALVPLRYSRMLASPFSFLRGAAAIMAADLRPSPVTGLDVQACGDMHVANFGIFASAERNLIFGINDFDETLQGPWEWDVKRLVASAWVCIRFLGGSKAIAEEAVRAAVSAYRTRLREYSGMGHLKLWYSRIDEEAVLGALSAHPHSRKRAEKYFSQARRHTNLQVLDKMTAIVDDRRRIIEDRPLIVRETRTTDGRPILEGLELLLRSYLPTLNLDRRRLLEQYQIVDVARKVVGVGSVGTACWVVFMHGRTDDDPLFLQVKEAQPSVLETHGGLKCRAESEGRRVVEGQRLIQGAPDIFLGWGQVGRFQLYVRQLRDMKGGIDFNPATADVGMVPDYCALCGWALALAHARSGDASAITGYVGTSEALDDALSKFARAYSDQTERDYDLLVKAARARRVPVARAKTQK
ncbi:MAG TPA: DUF2252 domain-containing protein [Thermoanaerobaculia bacterium]|nr:DUF2252 domain-containing protein [Thermoanaerobaculia bacterium]